MKKSVLRIERVKPRPGGQEYPVLYPGGYQLRRSDLPEEGKNRGINNKHVRTLEEAADYLSRGYYLRMGREGVKPSFIAPASLRVIWAT